MGFENVLNGKIKVLDFINTPRQLYTPEPVLNSYELNLESNCELTINHVILMIGFFPRVKIMSQFDPINSPFWNLSQTLLWILYRDPKWIRRYQEEPDTGLGGDILYGGSFKVQNVHSAENELLQALQTGKINAIGLQNGLGDPIDIATDTWAYLIFKSIPPRAAPSGAPRKGSSMYSQLQFQSQDVKNIWPTTGGTNTDQEIEQNPHIDSISKTPSIKQQAKELKTEERYKTWQKEAKKFKRKHPNWSVTRIAESIAKMDIAKGRKADTIRRQIKNLK